MRCASLLLVLAALAAADDAKDVAGHVATLKTGDARTRTRAVKALAAFDLAAAHDALEAALEDKDPTVRTLAAAGLLRRFRKHGRARGVLVSALSGGDWYAAWQACIALRRLGPAARDVVPALLNAARDPKADIAQEALLALAAIAPGEPDVVQAYRDLLTSDRKLDRRAALAYLKKHDALKGVGPWLTGELRSNKHGLRQVAYRLLVGDVALKAFADVLADGPLHARLLAARGLGKTASKEAGAPLAAALEDDVAEVRAAAAEALGELEELAAPQTAALVKALADGDRPVLMNVVGALEKIGAGSRAAEGALIRLLAQPDPALADAVLKTLDEYPASMTACLRPGWENATKDGKATRVWRVRLRPELAEAEAHDAIVARLKENKSGPAVQAALRSVLAPDLDADLRACVRGRGRHDPETRAFAAELLVELGTDRAAARKAIEEAAADRRAAVRDAMRAILERLR
ncbi:MAG: HEAT repeat domain-containing protein [Planctomycetota bacterium]|nr:HEAT repeat domain-containing protein [Planctomycetota bacterium]